MANTIRRAPSSREREEVASERIVSEAVSPTINDGRFAIKAVAGWPMILEAVFVALLSHEIDKSDLVAGLIAYRAGYFLLPLTIALVIYLWMKKAGKARQHDRSCDLPSTRALSCTTVLLSRRGAQRPSLPVSDLAHSG